jgi:hypothetical protein
MTIKAVALCWYQPDQWDKVVALREDKSVMAASYDLWLAGAEKFKERSAHKGIRVIPVDINADELAAWCASQGLNINGEACNRFATLRATRRIRGKNN